MESTPHLQTDGGRSESGLTEQKDCTVRAFAIARNIPYAAAHRELAKLGRLPGRGFKFRIVAQKRPDLSLDTPKNCGTLPQ